MSTKKNYVTIRPSKDGAVFVGWGYEVLYRTTKTGRLSCFMPGFKIFFSANDFEDLKKRSKALTRMYFDHLVIHSGKGLKALALQLHKLGFRANDDAITIRRMIQNESVNAKFSSNSPNLIPENFSGSESVNQESEMEISI